MKIFKLIIIGLMLFNFFSRGQIDSTIEMTTSNLKDRLNKDTNLVVIDVRNPDELASNLGKIDGVINIPVHVLSERVNELSKFKNKEIAVICRSGNRSKYGTEILRRNGFNAKNVVGGMIEFRKNR